ncbi:helix-turn-helix transcriptional regulator [uncultured Anaerovibrio sp.]|uniref:helix-turn-helix transcriptional regulator n=1 Tax=uncultured Anaerovibrio sp. TaxID=361586 RepID=UPI002623B647|nr:helix-turn-helix transcriptional regulator [uncultured Anaerovibrio sp.]
MAELITKIHELRRSQKLSQGELAEVLGIRRETLSHLENGKYNPSLKLAMDIAKYFGKSVEEVFEFVDEE